MTSVRRSSLFSQGLEGDSTDCTRVESEGCIVELVAEILSVDILKLRLIRELLLLSITSYQ